MEDKKKFTWWCDDFMGYQPHFETIDEVKTNIQKEYQKALEDIKNGYDPDDNYWSEDLPNEVIIGEVEEVDKEDMANQIFDSVKSCADDYIDVFAFGTDVESDFYTSVESDNKLKEAIKEWLNSSSMSPTIKGHEIERFKLE